MSYQYRRLRVTLYDRHSDPSRRRGGRTVDRSLTITDSAQPPFSITDREGDDFDSFFGHALGTFMAFLDQMGHEGWILVSWTPELEAGPNPAPGTARYRSHPVGWHLFMREFR